MTSPIVTLVVGNEQRLFAAHEDILCVSPYFQSALKDNHSGSSAKRLVLSDEEPEIFSSVLEFLYKGDYYPRLLHNKRKNSWELEDGEASAAAAAAGRAGVVESTVFYPRGVRLDHCLHLNRNDFSADLVWPWAWGPLVEYRDRPDIR